MQLLNAYAVAVHLFILIEAIYVQIWVSKSNLSQVFKTPNA